MIGCSDKAIEMKLAAPTMPPKRLKLVWLIFLLFVSVTPRAMAQTEDVTGWQRLITTLDCPVARTAGLFF